MKVLVTIGPAGEWTKSRFEVVVGKVGTTTLTSPYLYSAGQEIPVDVQVDMVKPSEPGDKVIPFKEDLVEVKPSWDRSYIPSDRPLWAIMQDVVDHTARFPSHGAMCVCMDNYAREIKQHISKAIPPDGRPLDGWWPGKTDPIIRARVMAHQRITHVLGMVMRSL